MTTSSLTTSSQLSESIFKAIQTYNSLDYNEFEVRIQLMNKENKGVMPSIGNELYNNFLQFLRFSGLFEAPLRKDYSVAIYQDKYRCIKTQSKDGYNYKWESKIKTTLEDYYFSDLNDNMRFRFSGAKEEEISNPYGKIVPPPSAIRNIMRNTFYLKENKNIKVDISTIMMNQNKNKIYEIEIEMNDVIYETSYKILELFYKLCINFSEMDEMLSQKVLREFRGVIKSQYIKNNAPITFTKSHLNIFENGVYAITNKLDGERVYLFISKMGLFVIPANYKNIRWIKGVYTPFEYESQKLISYANTILDAELFYNVNNNKIEIHIFDILYDRGNDIRKQSFIKRYEIANMNYNKLVKNEIIYMKKYWCTSQVIQDITNCEIYMDNFYNIEQNDGMIFNNIFGSYDATVYKLKPLNRMSIDVILQSVKSSESDFLVRILSKVKGSEELIPFQGTDRYPFIGIFELSPSQYGEYMTNRLKDTVVSDVVELEWRDKFFIITRKRADKQYPNVVEVVKINWDFINDPVDVNTIVEQYTIFGNKSKHVADMKWSPFPAFNNDVDLNKFEKAKQKYIEFLNTKLKEDDVVVKEKEKMWYNNYKFINFPKFKLTTEESKYSLSKEFDAYITSLIILSYIDDPEERNIFDATSSVGGNSFSFGHYFNKVISCEPNITHFNDLNFNTRKLSNIQTINDTYERCLTQIETDYDIIFFDPPWGGKDYKSEEFIRLKLGDKYMEQIIKEEIKKDKMVVVKVPNNYLLKLKNITFDEYEIINHYNNKPLYKILVFSKNAEEQQQIYKMPEEITINEKTFKINYSEKKFYLTEEQQEFGTKKIIIGETKAKKTLAPKKTIEDKHGNTLNLCSIYKHELDINYYIVNVPGDGSCFFHSYLYLMNEEYFNADGKNKTKIIIKERQKIAEETSFEKWNNEISYTFIPELQTKLFKSLAPKKDATDSIKLNMNRISDICQKIFISIDKILRSNPYTTINEFISIVENELKATELKDTNQKLILSQLNKFSKIIYNKFIDDIKELSCWVNFTMLLYLCKFYNINIHLVYNKTGVYNYNAQLIPQTNNIVMNYSDGHFEPIVGKYKEMYITSFSETDPFINNLQQLILNKNKQIKRSETEIKKLKQPQTDSLNMYKYTNNTFVVLGHAQHLNEQFKAFNCKWIPTLKQEGFEGKKGWVCSLTKVIDFHKKFPFIENHIDMDESNLPKQTSVKISGSGGVIDDDEIGGYYYTEKAFVITGNTSLFKDAFKEFGCKWNPNLKQGEFEGKKGWMCSMKKLDKFKEKFTNIPVYC